MEDIPKIESMAEEWVNWSGSMRFTPGVVEKPKNEEEVQLLVRQAIEQKKTIRIAGAGHSSVPLVQTDQILIDQENLKGITSHDIKSYRVKILPGTHILEAGQGLIKLRMSMHNTGDVDFQRLSGAFGTGTHGSGRTLPNLSAMMVGCRLVDGTGKIRKFTAEQDPEMINALRVALGSLGFFTELTIQAEPAEQFVRKEYCTHIDTCMEHLDELIANNRMLDFYWYPRNDLAKIRLCHPKSEESGDLPYAEKVKHQEGWLYKILPRYRTLKFEEMEYAIPYEAGPECFQEIRKRVKEKHRQYVGWRVFYRTIAADDAFLSPFYKRESVTIALLQNNELEYESYFKDIEPIFRAYGGRPHWGKKHYLKAEDLKPLYPEWDRFLAIRKQMDPEGVFLNDYLKKILGV